MAQIEITEEGAVKLEVCNIEIKDGNVRFDESDNTRMHNQYICELLNDEKAYKEYIDKVSLNCWKDYRVWLIRGLGAITFKTGIKESLKSIYCSLFRPRAKSLLMNAMQCESHRWTILRAQRIIKK